MKKILIAMSMIMTMISCGNPFMSSWETPYGIPDFEKVKEKHYIPAVKAGIGQQQSEIDAIAANSEEPTFENVVEAYEASGAILDRVVGVLFNLSETDSTPALQEIVEQVLPMLSEHTDNIFMTAALFVLHFQIAQFNVDNGDFLFDFFDFASGFSNLLIHIDMDAERRGNCSQKKENQHQPAELSREFGIFTCCGTCVRMCVFASGSYVHFDFP